MKKNSLVYAINQLPFTKVLSDVDLQRYESKTHMKICFPYETFNNARSKAKHPMRLVLPNGEKYMYIAQMYDDGKKYYILFDDVQRNAYCNTATKSIRSEVFFSTHVEADYYDCIKHLCDIGLVSHTSPLTIYSPERKENIVLYGYENEYCTYVDYGLVPGNVTYDDPIYLTPAKYIEYLTKTYGNTKLVYHNFVETAGSDYGKNFINNNLIGTYIISNEQFYFVQGHTDLAFESGTVLVLSNYLSINSNATVKSNSDNEEHSETNGPLALSIDIKSCTKSCKLAEKEKIKRHFVIGQNYMLKSKTFLKTEPIKRIYELKKFVYTMRGTPINVLIMKQTSGPKSKMYTLSQKDCALFHVKYEPGLQIMSMKLNWILIDKNTKKS